MMPADPRTYLIMTQPHLIFAHSKKLPGRLRSLGFLGGLLTLGLGGRGGVGGALTDLGVYWRNLGFGGRGGVGVLLGTSGGVPHCLHPEIVEHWQAKGYEYRVGFCQGKCERRAGELSFRSLSKGILALDGSEF
jgi:hypothetical protein